MSSEIERHREELITPCRTFRVRRLELFGSAAAGEVWRNDSDLEFLVEFDPGSETDYTDRYLGLLESLQALFGRSVNLVVSSVVRNPYFRAAVERTNALP